MSIYFLFKRHMIYQGNLFPFKYRNRYYFCLILLLIKLSSLSLTGYLKDPTFASSYNLSRENHLTQLSHSSNSWNHLILLYLIKSFAHHTLEMCTFSLFTFTLFFLSFFLALIFRHLHHFMVFDFLYHPHHLQNSSFARYIQVQFCWYTYLSQII